MGNNSLTISIIKTLCYAQIFSYPLTVSELWQYLIHSKKVSREEFVLHLHQNKHIFEHIQQYIVLPGDKKLVSTRAQRAFESRHKLAKALWISQVLSYIPTIKLVAISGSLSMYNAKKEDDIDLFFITARNTLWGTRFVVNLLLFMLGEKRNRRDHLATDKICPNMFISENALEMKTHNLYMAHEVSQIKVLFVRDDMYHAFLAQNKWVLRFLPHAFEIKKLKKIVSPKKKKTLNFARFLEPFCYLSQYIYMKKRITNEQVGRGIAAFHPRKTGESVLVLYKLKINSYIHIIQQAQKKKKLASIHLVN